jgi:preprotein translocase subunit SecG
MSTNSHVKKKVTAVLSIVFLLPALILFIMWTSIGIRFSDMNEVDKQDTFLGYFSGFFKDIHIIHIVSIIFCLAAIILASRSFQKRLLSLRFLMLMTVLISIFIILFDISQLV